MLKPAYAEGNTRASRLAALRRRHEQISDKLDTLKRSPSISDFYLNELKKQKLRVKDAMEEVLSGRENVVA